MNRKRFSKFMLVPILVLAMFTTVFASSPGIFVSNEKLPVSAVNKEGSVLVPLRAIFESLNATVEYDSKTKTITGNQDGKIIILKVNDKVATVDGKKVTLDVPATVIKGSTLVPVRFIGESLGANVDWYDNTVLVNSDREIVVKKPNNQEVPQHPTTVIPEVPEFVQGTWYFDHILFEENDGKLYKLPNLVTMRYVNGKVYSNSRLNNYHNGIITLIKIENGLYEVHDYEYESHIVSGAVHGKSGDEQLVYKELERGYVDKTNLNSAKYVKGLYTNHRNNKKIEIKSVSGNNEQVYYDIDDVIEKLDLDLTYTFGMKDKRITFKKK